MRRSIVLAACFVTSFGCQKPVELIGTWKYGMDTVEFKADHTFVQKDHKGEIGGMWIRTGDVVTLTPQTIAGQPIEKFRPKILRLAKSEPDRRRLNQVLDQWLSTNNFRIDRVGLTMDIVDPSGKRKDSLMRSSG